MNGEHQAAEALGDSIASGFARHAAQTPDALALHVSNRDYSYSELDALARRWASALVQPEHTRPARVGIFASRSIEGYAGMLASLYAGAAFVPFHNAHPAERLAVMARAAELDAIIADEQSLPALKACLALMPKLPLVLVPQSDSEPPQGYDGRWIGRMEIAAASCSQTVRSERSDYAYLLFTSGTTGVPKAVCVTNGNVSAFVENTVARFPFVPQDRFSQTYDQTFDLSIFDLFIAWSVGASVHVLSTLELIAPGRFIDTRGITVWSSVPSVIGLMRRKNFLPAGRFPLLRYSMFCGEALTVENASAWIAAAPNSVVENLYGPTEATVACTGFQIPQSLHSSYTADGKVSIGKPFPGHEAVVVDESLRPVPDGSIGELCIAGPQVTDGYWKAPHLTAAAFVHINTGDERLASLRFYRTGDLAERLPSGDLFCLGRIDHQVKIRGRRVELGEIEMRVARFESVTEAVAVGWPLDADDRPIAVAVAVTGAAPSMDEVRQALSIELPDYMIPTRILPYDEFPLNVNGKVDRRAILQRLKLER